MTVAIVVTKRATIIEWRCWCKESVLQRGPKFQYLAIPIFSNGQVARRARDGLLGEVFAGGSVVIFAWKINLPSRVKSNLYFLNSITLFFQVSMRFISNCRLLFVDELECVGLFV